MRISGLKSAERQLLLWERPLAGPGGVRNAVGDLMERLTAIWVGGVHHKTQSNCDYCPDVSGPYYDVTDEDMGGENFTGTQYYESKGAGRAGNTFIYGGRLAKDREFVASGRRLTYVIWHHRATTAGMETHEQVERAVLASLQAVYVVPFIVIDEICRLITPVPLNSKYGGSDKRPEYGSGYVIRLALLEPWLTEKFSGSFTDVSGVSPTSHELQILHAEVAPDTANGKQVPILLGEASTQVGVPPYSKAECKLLEHEPPPTNPSVGERLGTRYASACLWDVQQEAGQPAARSR